MFYQVHLDNLMSFFAGVDTLYDLSNPFTNKLLSSLVCYERSPLEFYIKFQ